MPPGDGGVGEILVAEMLRCVTIMPVSLAGLMTLRHLETLHQDLLAEQRCFVPPCEFARRDAPGLKGTLTTITDRFRRYEPAIKRLSREVINFVRQESPDQIWAILDSTVAIDVASAVRDAVDIPMLVHIWDDPRHIIIQRQLDRLTRARTLKRFNGLLRRADRLGVICEQMAEEYAQKSSAPAIVIRHGLQDHVVPNSEPTSGDEFRIGISGSMYCHSAWKAFQAALDKMNWHIGGKRIVLVVAGHTIEFTAFRPAECRFYGWRSVADVIQLLSNCDVLYLPHPFEPLYEPMARLSFPTKLSTYVATGRPVLLHAPTYSSLTKFSKQHQFGLLTPSLDPSELREQLLEKFTSVPALQELSRATARVGSTILGRSQFVTSTQAFLAPHSTSTTSISFRAMVPVAQPNA